MELALVGLLWCACTCPVEGRRGGRSSTMQTSGTLTQQRNSAGNDDELGELDVADTLLSSVVDDGAPARCNKVTPDLDQGNLECDPLKSKCALAGKIEMTTSGCREAWGGNDPTCPDGIDHDGVFISWFQPMCARWESDRIISGSNNCKTRLKSGKLDKVTCTKANIRHADMTSRSSGMLIMKRTHCERQENGSMKCNTFKAGKCIDVGQDVWAHYWNDWIGTDYRDNAKAFALAATEILKKYANSTDGLPKEYECSNTRHTAIDSCSNQERSCICQTRSNCNVPKATTYTGGCCSASRHKTYTLQDKTKYNLVLMMY